MILCSPVRQATFFQCATYDALPSMGGAYPFACVLYAPCLTMMLALVGNSSCVLQVVKVTGVPTTGKTMTVLMRGSNRMVLDEAERSVHDALCVVRSLVRSRGVRHCFFQRLGYLPTATVMRKLPRERSTYLECLESCLIFTLKPR